MKETTIIKLSVFFTGFAGLVSEYTIATLATYLLGNAVFQWSVIISVFLLFMGVGSRLSKSIKDEFLISSFIISEILLSIFVSFSPLIAYNFASHPERLQLVVIILSAIIGTLIGLEIPLAVRINEKYENLKVSIASILEKDYLGSLPAGLLYAYFLLPKLGLIHTALISGVINLITASLFTFKLSNRKIFKFLVPLIALILTIYGLFSEKIFLYYEQKFYGEQIVFFKRTNFQKIVLTEYKGIYSLYLDGHLQFSTIDEKRYHEVLVHVPCSFLKSFEKALILGGGDGLALREVLKYPFKEITLVEIDKGMIEFSKKNGTMKKINEGSFYDKRVKVVIDDAFNFVFKTRDKYDLVIVDLIDPRTPSSARVYSLEFYKRVYEILKKDGILITQASDAFYKRKVFCSILKTIERAGFYTVPLRINVPSMGEWGLVAGFKEKVDYESIKINEKLTEFLTTELARTLNKFPKKFSCKGVKINTLLKPVILSYYYESDL